MADESPLDIDNLTGEAENAIRSAPDLRALDEMRVRYLGKSGLLTAQFDTPGKGGNTKTRL